MLPFSYSSTSCVVSTPPPHLMRNLQGGDWPPLPPQHQASERPEARCERPAFFQVTARLHTALVLILGQGWCLLPLPSLGLLEA